MSKNRFSLFAVAAAAIVLAAVPSASARPTGAHGQAASPQEIKVAVFPTVDYAPMYVGLKLGIFKKHGLDVKIQYVFTGAGLFAAITSGQTDLATNSPAAGSNAISQGLPIKMVTAADFQPTTGNTEVLVKSDSSIKSFADLAGKTVATINLQGLFNLGVNYAVEKSGGDPASVHALAMSPADEGPALLAGRVDAIVLQDPFLSQAKAQPGYRSLGNPFKLFPFKVPVGAFWSSASTIQAKSALLKNFLAAWTESVAVAKKHPQTTREVISKYTGISADTAKTITIPDYTSGLPPDSLGPMLLLMKKYGWLSVIPSYSQIHWDGK